MSTTSGTVRLYAQAKPASHRLAGGDRTGCARGGSPRDLRDPAPPQLHWPRRKPGQTLAVAALGNAAATLLILRATDLFGPGRSQTAATQLALVLYVLYNLAATLISVPAGWHGDRSNPIRVLAAGAVCFAADAPSLEEHKKEQYTHIAKSLASAFAPMALIVVARYFGLKLPGLVPALGAADHVAE
jgi:MFS family permease